MNYRRLGKAGIKVSELSFGAWVTFGGPKAEEVQGQCMKACYDAGIHCFDNAEAYANGQAEVVMAEVIRRLDCGGRAWCCRPSCSGAVPKLTDDILAQIDAIMGNKPATKRL